MELHKMDALLEKYFDGGTSIAEENELRSYFCSLNVAPEHEQYRHLFRYFAEAKEEPFDREVKLTRDKAVKKRRGWMLSVAASAMVLLGVGAYTYISGSSSQGEDLGTYDSPEEAFIQTQKALALLSREVNTGIGSVQYVQQYEDSKNLIFKQ